ncbi:MAG TPA: ATP-binding protein [Thermomicrobiales bacterium]|jgi:PAS domain S-box-containing protein
MPALDNAERLAALRYLDLFNPAKDIAFDRLARLATNTLHVPVALVSFVSDQRQLLHGAAGVPETVASTREMSLSHSFCQHVVTTDAPLIIEDARDHPLVRENLAIPDFGVVAYAGIPLRSGDGQVLGSFCAIDTRPHRWTAEELAALTDFAEAAMSEIELRATVRETERARHEWLALLDSSGEGVYGIDLAGCCTYVNDAALTFFGYEAGELLGQNMHALLHSRYEDGSSYPVDDCPIHQMLHTGLGVRLREEVMWHKSGVALPTLYSCSPVMKDGVVAGGVVTVVDIGEQRRAAEWQNLLAETGATLAASLDQDTTLAALTRLIVPRLADWCTIDLVGDDGRLTRAAFAHADPAKAGLLREMGERYPPAASAPSPLLTVMRSGQPLLQAEVSDTELVAMTHGDEHLRLVETLGLASGVVLPLLARGHMLGVLSLVRTGTRRYQRADLAPIEELTRRCALALDNARLYQQAQEAVRLRDQFVAIASHELRTPVTSIRGYAQLLERQAAQGTLDTARASRHAGQIVVQASRLAALISDLLDASRFQQGRLDLNLEPCDLTALASEALAAFRTAPERTPQHSLRFIGPLPVIGRWDRARLDQVLTNLLSNALKYSPTGGEVCVEVRATADGRAILLVSDQGLGIPPSEQARLFQPFVRGGSSHGQIGGTGLGLYIVRQIVEGHGGTIAVESTLGEGTTFTVTLPLTLPAT